MAAKGKANSKAAASRANRPVRFDQFKKQVQELGISDECLQRIDFTEDESVVIRLGAGYNSEDHEAFIEELQDAVTDEEKAMVLLSYNKDMSAEQQWEICQKHGCTAGDLAVIFANATRELEESMGKIRLRRS